MTQQGQLLYCSIGGKCYILYNRLCLLQWPAIRVIYRSTIQGFSFRLLLPIFLSQQIFCTSLPCSWKAPKCVDLRVDLSLGTVSQNSSLSGPMEKEIHQKKIDYFPTPHYFLVSIHKKSCNHTKFSEIYSRCSLHILNCCVLMKLSSRKVIIINVIHALCNEQDKTKWNLINSVSGGKKT